MDLFQTEVFAKRTFRHRTIPELPRFCGVLWM